MITLKESLKSVAFILIYKLSMLDCIHNFSDIFHHRATDSLLLMSYTDQYIKELFLIIIV